MQGVTALSETERGHTAAAAPSSATPMEIIFAGDNAMMARCIAIVLSGSIFVCVNSGLAVWNRD